MRIHLIAIGGAVMHNLAIALKNNGHIVSGSDDEIFEPSKSRLEAHGLLPEKQGWDSNRITKDIDAVILGMHARADNPEFIQAEALQIPIYSFPEYIYEHSKNKLRVAICGSHGKTTITSMIMHCLKHHAIKFDYLVGAKLEGFDTMVQLSDAPIMIIEGDEYFASPIDMRPKFLLYHAQIILISGIAWDHFNVFPTWENYLNQFSQLIASMTKNDTLVFNAEDKNIAEIITENKNYIPYNTPQYTIENDTTIMHVTNKTFAFSIFGKHNMQNLEGAKNICKFLGVDDFKFYEAMQSFKGAARRLEILQKSDSQIIFRDFAHSPSKVKATVDAVKEMYPNKKLLACFELHTFSSLNKSFMHLYENTMHHADIKIVYFNPHTLQLKKLPSISAEEIKHYFNDADLLVLNDSKLVLSTIQKYVPSNTTILLMSSGNFDNINFNFSI